MTDIKSSNSNEQINNPLHGVKLADMLEFLVEYYCFWVPYSIDKVLITYVTKQFYIIIETILLGYFDPKRLIATGEENEE